MRPWYQDPAKVRDDFLQNLQYVKGVLGEVPPTMTKFARLPGANTWRVGDLSVTGSIGTKNKVSTGPAADLIAKEGYGIFGWDAEWEQPSGGGLSQSAQEMANIIMRTRTRRSNEVVLLAHDRQFKGQGEKLVDLVELLKLQRVVFQTLASY
jgi:hypothetical protein